jgi:hypothetical protein
MARGWKRSTVFAASLVALVSLGAPGTSSASPPSAGPVSPGGAGNPGGAGGVSSSLSFGGGARGCRLGNGITHVVELGFDNVHFFRDNPDVPSDLEMMPNLLNFLEDNGTVLSNNHTPLIAHTGDDLLTTFTGLYGDRQGMPVANDYRVFNPDGTTDAAGSFAYWTDPVFDTTTAPNPGSDTNPNMVYSATPPATTRPAPAPNTITPAPWVSFTRAGCNVGGVAAANMELENTSIDIPKVFGASSPEEKQLINDPDSFKDPETADYVGLAIHCARGSEVCADATAVKNGETAPSNTAVPDLLPDEPGGYNGYRALFGAKYIDPVLGAGTPDVSHDGYAVTNAAGNVVDLDGNEIDGAFLNNYPGFPGFDSINAAQTLAYMSDMLESGVPVVYGYMADLHGNEDIPALTSACANAPEALGSGSPCYIAQAQYYNAAFGLFFKRLAQDGITPQNTLFVLSSDEGDHEAGANVGRALQPTPAGCDGATVSGDTVSPDVFCNYTTSDFGELDANITGLLANEFPALTRPAFTIEPDTAPEFYVTGNPAASSGPVRNLEHQVADVYADNPYSGNTHELITNYLADPTEEAVLHMVNADPNRTPTFAMFAKPDYYVSTGSATCNNVTGNSNKDCIDQTNSFAYDHGDYAAEIDTNWAAFVGPGVANLGVDGSPPNGGPNSAGPNSGQVTVPQSGTTGTWIDEADIRPTLMYLTGLKDDYIEDGRVITQILGHPAANGLSSPSATDLAACYKQLNSSVGELGTATLQASTNAIESSSPGDNLYTQTEADLSGLDKARDHLAIQVKDELWGAEFGHGHISPGVARSQAQSCESLIEYADHLAEAGPGSLPGDGQPPTSPGNFSDFDR